MLKAAYFANWTPGRLLHVQSAGWDELGIAADFEPPRRLPEGINPETVIRSDFQPEITFYRPVSGKKSLHAFAMRMIETCDAPLALWMMDDWPARLEREDPEAARQMNKDLERLFARSAVNYAISEGMAEAFQQRYGVAFEVAHNGVDPRDWPAGSRQGDRQRRGTVRMRYHGGLAPDMSRTSVYRVAHATSRLVEQGVPLRFEIRTQAAWYKDNVAQFRGLKGVSFRRARKSAARYRRELSEADILLLAYNFDEATRQYVRYSFANKTPELLASGAAVLAVGPKDLETIRFLQAHGLAHCVTQESEDALVTSIRSLVQDRDMRQQLSVSARRFAFEEMRLDEMRARMRERLRTLSLGRPQGDAPALGAHQVCDVLAPPVSPYQRLANHVAERSPFLFRLLQGPARFLKRLAGAR